MATPAQKALKQELKLIKQQYPTMRKPPHRNTPQVNKNYAYSKLTYCLTKAAYIEIVNSAREANYIRSSQTAHGLSDFINSITLEPKFTPDELNIIDITKSWQHQHDVHLNGEYKWHYKFSLAPETIAHLSALGLQYALWQKRQTPTSLVSNTLEAFGNGKFTYKLRNYTLPHLKDTYVPKAAITLYVTRQQQHWLIQHAIQAGYEPELGAPRTTSRGYNNFIKDFVHLNCIPYDPTLHDTHPNTPPKRQPGDPIDAQTWKTTQQLQQVLDHELFVPQLPYWPDTPPDGLDYETSRANQLQLLRQSQ